MKRMRSHSTTATRGQVAIPDILFAVSLFMIILAGIYFFNNSIQASENNQIARDQLDTVSANIAEYLVKNPGTPSAWETLTDQNQTQFFGLAVKDRVLDPQKVITFVNLSNTSYDFVKQRLGISHFNFYLQFSGGTNLSAGQAPPVNADQSVVKRFTTLNGIETTVTLNVYAT
jgi:hypothetical protein